MVGTAHENAAVLCEKIGAHLDADGHSLGRHRLGTVDRRVHAFWQRLRPRRQLRCEVAGRRNGVVVRPVHRAPGRLRSENVIWMLDVIGVDAEAEGLACRGMFEALLDGLHPAHPRGALFGRRGLHVRRALLQNDDVGDDFSPGVLGERGIGQTRGGDEVRALGDPLAYTAVLGIEELARDHHHQHAARPQLVDALGEEIIVDAEARIRAALRIDDGFTAERRIADGHVEEFARNRHVLKPVVTNRRLRIQRGGDLLGQRIEFNTEQGRGVAQLRRHAAEEMADACSRLQNPPARDAQARQPDVHTADDGLAGVMRVQYRRTRRPPLRVREQPLQFSADLRPLRISRIEHALERAPADIPGQLLALLRRRHTVLGGECLHDANGGEIVPRLARESALTQIVRQPFLGRRGNITLCGVGHNGRGCGIVDHRSLFVYSSSSPTSLAASSS